MHLNFALLIPLTLHIGALVLGALVIGIDPTFFTSSSSSSSSSSSTTTTEPDSQFKFTTFTRHSTLSSGLTSVTQSSDIEWWYYDRTCGNTLLGSTSCTQFENVQDVQNPSSESERSQAVIARVLKKSLPWLVPLGVALHAGECVLVFLLVFGILKKLLWSAFGLFLIVAFLDLAAVIVVTVVGAFYATRTVTGIVTTDTYTVTFGTGFWFIIGMEGVVLLSALTTPLLRRVGSGGGGDADRARAGTYGYNQF